MDLSWLQNHAPFMALATGAPKLSGTRIAEALIIAGVTAYATSYVTVAKIETKVDLQGAYYNEQFKTQVARRDAELAALKAGMQSDVARQQAQYEVLRTEIQRLALAVERGKK